MTHTPSPWKIPPIATLNIVSSNGILIADCTHGWAGSGNEREANARLIAAAPDLLDTLQALVEQYGRTYDNNDSQQVQAYYDAKAAIKKAKGEFK